MKILTVATEIQRQIFNRLLLQEIIHGFWKQSRSNDWEGIDVKVGSSLGISGFTIPRNYNFVNPNFFKLNSNAMLQIGLEIDPTFTLKTLKKELTSLNQILGNRLKDPSAVPIKLRRGNKQREEELRTSSFNHLEMTVRRVPATFVDSDQASFSGLSSYL